MACTTRCLVRVLTTYNRTIVRLRVRRSTNNFGTRNGIFPLVGSTKLGTCMRFLSLQFTVRQALQINVGVVNIVTHTRHGRKTGTGRSVVLNIMTNGRKSFSRFGHIMITALPLVRNTFSVSARNSTHLRQRLLNGPVNRTVTGLRQGTYIMTRRHTILGLPYQSICAIFPLFSLIPVLLQ